MSDELRAIGAFRLCLYHHSSTESVREFEGVGAEWHLQPTLSVSIYDVSYAVRIDTVFVDLVRGNESRIEQIVDGLCSVRKFGDWLQLREPFRVVIEVDL
jgi:2-phosphoglycerate kinase